MLPRRSYAPLLGRILHDRTADKIAEVVSQVPNAAAMIIPFDVESRVHLLHARHAARLTGQTVAAGRGPGRRTGQSATTAAAAVRQDGNGAQPPAPPAGVTVISELNGARKAIVEGKVRSVEIHPVENSCVFDATVADETGTLTAKFYGRTSIPGFEPGARLRLQGKVSMREDGPAMINPAYQLVAKD